jgi:NADH-quinone oxidoreductase chain G
MGFSVFINKKEILILKKKMLIQVCNQNNIDIPRFCFHEKLSIAGNCRLCLVEIEKFLKPAAACAYPLIPNLVVYTNTLLVKKAREGILEFLLINHPLDCPICDWAGECDLQDQVLVFGGDRGRFYDFKRAVEEKKSSLVIKMLMTRCIHCTRCVRFLTELGGNFRLGVIGRGSKMEISTFLTKWLNSEISGNIIDLCPVGALTSELYSFKNRPWRSFIKINSIDIFDCLGSNIFLEIMNGKISRVLPRFNLELNEEWISDKIRFFYDSLEKQRLGYPFLIELKDKKIIYVSWEQAFLFIKKKFKFFFNKFGSCSIFGVFGPLVDFETLAFFKIFLNKLGSSQIYSTVSNNVVNFDSRSTFFFSLNFQNLENIESCFFFGLDLGKESPILQLKLRKCFQSKPILLFLIGSFVSDMLNNQMHVALNNFFIFKLFEGTSWLCRFLVNVNNSAFFVGNSLVYRKDFKGVEAGLYRIKTLLELSLKKNLYLNFFFNHVSTLNGLELGIKNVGSFSQLTKLKKKKIVFFLGTSGVQVMGNKNDSFYIYQGFLGDKFIYDVDVVLPSVSFIEKDSLFLNCFGNLQVSKKALNSYLNSKKDSEIFMVLSFFLDKNLIYFSKFYVYSKIFEISPLILKKFKINSFFKKFNFLKKEFILNSVINLTLSNFYNDGSLLSKNSKTLMSLYKSFIYTNIYINKKK